MSVIKKQKTYHLHDEWEENYFFNLIKEKCVCLICNSIISISKKVNLERHYKSNRDFPPKSVKRRIQLNILKNQLEAQQSMFTKPNVGPASATEASFRISFLLARHKNPFSDGELAKKAFIKRGEVLFTNFKNKSAIM